MYDIELTGTSLGLTGHVFRSDFLFVKVKKQNLQTCTIASVSSVSTVTGTRMRSIGVSAVCIHVTCVIYFAFVNI